MHVSSRFVLLLAACLSATPLALAQSSPAPPTNVDAHSTEEWALIAPHLPDPVTGSPAKLETAGDVLRARRFPADAVMFYKSAILNGGNRSRLLKKEGVVELEMQQGALARSCFRQAVRLNKKDAEAWNNMGAADFMIGSPQGSISEYKRAVKLNRNSAVYHSNLALAYFETRDDTSARRELARAFALDPEIMQHQDAGGYNLQVLASAHYAEICFEMAHVYAAQNDPEMTVSWLTKASERGFDIRDGMRRDAVLQPYLQDARIKLLLANNDHRHNKDVAKVKPPSLSDVSSPR